MAEITLKADDVTEYEMADLLHAALVHYVETGIKEYAEGDPHAHEQMSRVFADMIKSLDPYRHSN